MPLPFLKVFHQVVTVVYFQLASSPAVSFGCNPTSLTVPVPAVSFPCLKAFLAAVGGLVVETVDLLVAMTTDVYIL
jgi:hypothetical protein